VSTSKQKSQQKSQQKSNPAEKPATNQTRTPVGIDFGAKTAGTTVIAWLEAESICFAASKKNADADECVLATLRSIAASNQAHRARLVSLASSADSASSASYVSSAPAHELCVCIDAPLSLPGVFTGLAGCDDYFYRASDRALRAMSPMFLGGLTARAMRLANHSASRLARRAAQREHEQNDEHGHIHFYETYPAEAARRLALKEVGYKQHLRDIPPVLQQIRHAVVAQSWLPASLSFMSFVPLMPKALPKALPDWHHVDALLALLSALRLCSGVCERFGTAAEGEIIV
jgi:uncharacterized protein